jgi:hypothetical protein
MLIFLSICDLGRDFLAFIIPDFSSLAAVSVYSFSSFSASSSFSVLFFDFYRNLCYLAESWLFKELLVRHLHPHPPRLERKKLSSHILTD